MQKNDPLMQHVCIRLRDKILQIVGDKSLAVQELSKFLKITPDTAYRRLINGHFSLDEVAILAYNYHLDLNAIFLGRNTIPFHFQFVENPIVSWSDYLSRLGMTFHYFNEKELSAKYFSRELPVFYYAVDDALAAFKLYAFSKKIWDLPEYSTKRFDLKKLSQSEWSAIEQFKEVSRRFIQARTEQVWHPDLFGITLNQIRAFAEGGYFESFEDISCVIDGVEKAATYLQENYTGYIQPFPHMVYAMDTAHFNNMILAKDNRAKMAFITFDNPNFAMSADEGLFTRLDGWFEKLKQDAYNPHYGGGGYFNNLFHRVKMQCKKVRDATSLIYQFNS